MTTVYVDTSAFLAVLNRNDRWAAPASATWAKLLRDRQRLVASSYVILETISLLQRRIGMEAVHAYVNKILPVIEVEHVDARLHGAALSSFLTASSRELSLVDCCSFELMRARLIDTAFAFDRHFEQQGFTLLDECRD